MYQPDSYRKYLLNRSTSTQTIIDYIENCLNSEEECLKHVYHKIMILHWADTDVSLFDTISKFFGGILIPVQYNTHNVLSSFYTNNLRLILKIVKLEFIFPYNRNMYNIDVLYNDKTSIECFGNQITLEDMVAGIVSRRFKENCELDLSNFCKDQELVENKVHFYKIGLLADFKIVMLRIGRDIKTLNLSNNNLSQVPQELLNFFIKGDLVAINFSNNMIPSIAELQRVSSRIEKLWLEGNPFCDEMDVSSYIKQLILRFPRLQELDGIELNKHGIMLPFYRNYLTTPERRTKLVVEKFITLYFSHYDSYPEIRCKKLQQFYNAKVKWILSADFGGADSNFWPVVYKQNARNLINPHQKKDIEYTGSQSVTKMLSNLPESVHDLTSFCVDVMLHTKKHLLMVVDGVFKEKYTHKDNLPINERHLSFRRTLLFTIEFNNATSSSTYLITKEMLTIVPASPDQVAKFKEPVRNMDTLSLVNPEKVDILALTRAFMHITQHKSMTACEQRLKDCNWDIKLALKNFVQDVQTNVINPSKMMDTDDFSDTSSLLDEID